MKKRKNYFGAFVKWSHISIPRNGGNGHKFNVKNPLAWLMLVLFSIVSGGIEFCKAVYAMWREVLVTDDIDVTKL